MSRNDPLNAMQVCVKTCPNKLLENPSDVYDFYQETGSKLCSYEIDPAEYKNRKLYQKTGPCPELPVRKR